MRNVAVFDLDDTLYKEVDFLKSGYRQIAKRVTEDFVSCHSVYEEMLSWWAEGKDVFGELCTKFPNTLTKSECLAIYRSHTPEIELSQEVVGFLEKLKVDGVKIGIITDGRELTQMNKIMALGLLRYVSTDDIVISESFGSEKPCERNYRYFIDRYPNARYMYIADNVKKDFITPNRLGWKTVCLLDDGRNIHKQDFNVGKEYLPQVQIESFRLPLRRTII